jgi:CheY-like chemotaxis protein
MIALAARLGAEPDRDEDEDDRRASLIGVRVLVVEDEPDARELAVMALEHRGAEVTAVPSSAAGVTAILSSGRSLPHVLVSDIGMPGENGYDFIKRVRALDPNQGGRIPAVSVTAYTTPKDVARALAAGYQLHVPKPMDPSALVNAVSKLARRGPGASALPAATS